MQQLNSTITMTSRIAALSLAAAVWGCGETAIQQPPIPQAPPSPSMTAANAGTGGASKAGSNDTKKNPDSSSGRDDDRDGGTGGSLGLDGDACNDDSECASGHCDNELCCAGGQCCVKTPDCDATDGIALVCDYATTCQGSRGEVVCENFRCATEDGTPNDTGCHEDVEADDCGPYLSVYCDGARDQDPPRCPETCAMDDECDPDAYCGDNAVCVRELPAPGGDPDEPAGPISCMLNSDCDDGVRCLNGICEGSDRPPPTPRDGGTASQSCLDSLGDGDCSQCACENCEATATACWDSGDAEREGLCSAVMECALAGGSCINPTDCTAGASMPGGIPGIGGGEAAYGCFGRSCYCGTVADCYTEPTGDCVEQIRAAAGNSTSASTISLRHSDPAFAIYDAEEHARCLQRSCRTECGL